MTTLRFNNPANNSIRALAWPFSSCDLNLLRISNFFPAPLDNFRNLLYFATMAETATPEVTPGTIETTEEKPKSGLEPGYLVICWNDPVNYMDYVTHVFRVVFGWNRKKAEFHMLQVHEQGKSILTRDSMEKAEHYVHHLQRYSLHATMERDE
jgi:ATP-dependent Clp protease adaptor protein ClpS